VAFLSPCRCLRIGQQIARATAEDVISPGSTIGKLQAYLLSINFTLTNRVIYLGDVSSQNPRMDGSELC